MKLSIGDRYVHPFEDHHFPGMTYRHWLIGQALCGLLDDPGASMYVTAAAKTAIRAADAILVELDKERNTT